MPFFSFHKNDPFSELPFFLSFSSLFLRDSSFVYPVKIAKGIQDLVYAGHFFYSAIQVIGIHEFNRYFQKFHI